MALKNRMNLSFSLNYPGAIHPNLQSTTSIAHHLYIHNTWVTNSSRNDIRELRNADDLYIPLARTDHVKKMPYFALPKMWNQLHDQKFTPNPITFKIAIKDYFLNLDNVPDN